jgi:hypothetical protein
MNRLTRERAALMRRTLSQMCRHDATEELVRRYFDPDGPFAGRTFMDLPPNEADTITPSDLLAVTLLDVRFPPPAVRWLLDLSHKAFISDLLQDLPEPGVALKDLKRKSLGPANVFWRMLVHAEPPADAQLDREGLRRAFHRVGPVKADKLLARKRPDAFPIYDRAFVDLFGKRHPEFDYWQATMDVLTDHDLASSLRSFIDGVPVVRILDAVVWMWQSGSDNAEAERTQVRVPKWSVLRDADGTSTSGYDG